ncbi:MAG: nitroreductase family protein [Candidatus Bathyarchaeia archaeon]|nr:nitroreductase family protein [Candidatus Bathyarchaeota archaeon]
MDLFQVLASRRSVRRFKPDPVPEGLVEKLLNAGVCAPTAGNIQPWRFIVVDDPSTLEMIRKVSPGYFGGAPLAIIVCSDRGRSYELGGIVARDYLSIVDCAIAAGYILLAAQALGLGGCCIKSFSTPAVKEILEIPGGVEPELMLAIGWPDEQPMRPPKLGLEEITYRNVYGERWRG